MSKRQETMKAFLIRIVAIITIMMAFAFSVPAQTTAENPIIRSELNEMFEDLDKTKVPTGYLLDYAVDMVESGLYDGIALTDSNYVSVSTFQSLMTSIKSAAVGTCPIGNIPQIMADFKSKTDDDIIDVAYMLYKYSFIKEEAIANNLLNYSSGKVSDKYIDGIWQNPYETAFMVGFTPNTNTSDSRSMKFRFSLKYRFTNALITRMEFDAGDGNGYRNVLINSIIPVNYSSSGLKELKFKFTLLGGGTLVCHSLMYIKNNSSTDNDLQSGEIYTPDPEKIPITYQGKTKAQMTIYYKSGNTQLTKPFIVVEGFDFFNLTNTWNNEEDLMGSRYHESFYKTWPFKDVYDLIYIDIFHPTDELIYNADLIINALSLINEKKMIDKCAERSIIMGQSMGGLIVRLALLTMEDMDIQHGVSTYISHDTPHLGANIPLGALYYIHQTLSFLNGFQQTVNLVDFFTENDIKDSRKALWEFIHSPAVKEMLVNYVNEDGILNNSEHLYLQNILNRMGFPQGDPGFPLEKLAIVNGHINDQTDIFSMMQGAHYFLMNGQIQTTYLADLLLPGLPVNSPIYTSIDFSITDGFIISTIYPESNRFDVHVEINPYIQYGTVLSCLNVEYTKMFSWKEPETYTIFNEQAYAPISGFLYDGLPSSIIYLHKATPDNNNYYDHEINLDNAMFEMQANLSITERIPFIPTASALNIFDETIENYNTDYYRNPPIPNIDCPFDAYALTNSPEEHITIDTSTFQWIASQTHMKIVGPTYVSSTASYSTIGYNGPLIWTSSNELAAIIDNSGRITATGGGHTTITAQYYSDGKLYRKSKDIVVNFPDITISHSYEAGDGYTFTAKCHKENVRELLETLVQEGTMQYEWTTLDTEGNRVTKVTPSNSITYLPKEDELLTVAVRLIDTSGNKSALKSLTFDLRTPMSMNYRYVVVDAQRNVYFVNDSTYEVDMPLTDFTAKFRNIPMNSDDSILSTEIREKYLKGQDCFIAYPSGLNNKGFMQGIPNSGNTKWSFGFFNHILFMNSLVQALSLTGGTERVMTDFSLTLCNSEKEPLQDIPFAIIYKPVFPEN